MKVSDLIALLGKSDPDATVFLKRQRSWRENPYGPSTDPLHLLIRHAGRQGDNREVVSPELLFHPSYEQSHEQRVAWVDGIGEEL